MGSGASAPCSAAASSTKRSPPARASHDAARGVGAAASTAVKPSASSPARSWRTRGGRPPKSFRLPETSSSSASWNSSATLGVNCATQPAMPSSASVSSAGSRGRASSVGHSASAAEGVRPGRTPRAAARASQSTTRRPSTTASGSGGDEPRVSSSTGRCGRWIAIQSIGTFTPGYGEGIENHGARERGPAAFEDMHGEAACAGIETQAQRGGRRIVRRLDRPEQEGARAAVLGGELQPAQVGVADRAGPREHRAAGARTHRLFGGPQRFLRRARLHHQHAREVDAGGGERRARRAGRAARSTRAPRRCAPAPRGRRRADAVRRCRRATAAVRSGSPRASRGRAVPRRARRSPWTRPHAPPRRPRRRGGCRTARAGRRAWTSRAGRGP